MKKSKKLLVLACTICLGTALCGTALSVRDIIVAPAEKYQATLSQPLSESYDFGVTFVVPSATIAIKGDIVTATSSAVIFPSGKVEQGADVVLDESGKYTLVYYATVGGKTYSARMITDESADSLQKTKNLVASVCTYE